MLDQKSEEALQQGELKFYPVKNATAARLAEVVEDIIDRMAMLTPALKRKGGRANILCGFGLTRTVTQFWQ